MNTAAILPLPQTLASVLRQAAAEAVAGSPACLWCGSATVTEASSAEWPPAIVLQCADCGSETSLDRRLARGSRQ
jgi:hypothetical protein